MPRRTMNDDDIVKEQGQWEIVEYDSSHPHPHQQSSQEQPQYSKRHQQQHQQQQQLHQQQLQQEQPARGPSRPDTGQEYTDPYKWKKRFLYIFLFTLMTIIVVNLTLTLWFLRVMQFTSDGMGTIKVVNGGIRLSGHSVVLDRLIASTIRSRVGYPISIESAANISIFARNSQGRLVNSLKLTKDKLECAATSFKVTDTRGEILFSADRSKVIVGAQELKVTGLGGAVFDGSVQTPMVRADSRHDLRLESASRKIELSGPQGVTIESRAGDITASCLMDLKLQSISGAIQIDAAKVFFKGLKTFSTDPQKDGKPNLGPTASRDKLPSVYQLCVCGNGKVFMSPPDGQCAADNESLVCR
ncbi:delta-sarcoglycan isoform X2 [Adelges cooleyi]|nr:delta-sarcoglycan isoform X2 [Adelges cooleyi]